MQCGVSCLAMICSHYGRDYSLEYLDRFCHANIAGVSMLGIADGAKSVGLETMTVAASTDELKEITLPCILHWNQNHFVVLYGISGNGKRYRIADPGKGLLSYTRKELESHWISSVTDGDPSGTVMQLTPTKTFTVISAIRQRRRDLLGFYSVILNNIVNISHRLFSDCSSAVFSSL